MENLPSVDLGLMAEHLAAHEGVINKLFLYESITTLPKLKEILQLQISIMMSHVDVMLKLIDPDNKQSVNVPPLTTYEDVTFQQHIQPLNDYTNKWVTLEAHNTAKCMSEQNYISSLNMKNPNVKKAHSDMALQQAHIQKLYNDLISIMNWSFVPHSTKETQYQTYQFYSEVYHE